MGYKPRIRFKGFTEDWEQCKLSDVADVRDGTHDSPKFYNDGFPLVTSKNLKGGSIDFSDCSFISEQDFNEINKRSKVDPGDILFGMIGTIGNPAIVEHTGFAIKNVALIKEGNIINNRFIYHLLSSEVFENYIARENAGGTQKFIALNQIRNFDFLAPALVEQNKIIELLDCISQNITLHQCKLEKLKLTKKALLQKLFPKNGKHIPEIRFKGFTDAWEQREFSDIFAEVKSGLSRMLSNDDIGLPVVRANNINDGQLNLFDDIKYWYKNDPQGANTNNYLIEQGDILINFINSEAKMGTAAYVTRRPERDTIYTTNILRCKVNDEYNPYFIYSLTFLNSYKNYIASITKPAVNQASFTTVDFKKYSIKIPTVKEQNQIANLIEIFNKFITLHQRKLERLQEVKKGLLQKMFV